jgi:hypothetical protein
MLAVSSMDCAPEQRLRQWHLRVSAHAIPTERIRTYLNDSDGRGATMQEPNPPRRPSVAGWRAAASPAPPPRLSTRRAGNLRRSRSDYQSADGKIRPAPRASESGHTVCPLRGRQRCLRRPRAIDDAILAAAAAAAAQSRRKPRRGSGRGRAAATAKADSAAALGRRRPEATRRRGPHRGRINAVQRRRGRSEGQGRRGVHPHPCHGDPGSGPARRPPPLHAPGAPVEPRDGGG